MGSTELQRTHTWFFNGHGQDTEQPSDRAEAKSQSSLAPRVPESWDMAARDLRLSCIPFLNDAY